MSLPNLFVHRIAVMENPHLVDRVQVRFTRRRHKGRVVRKFARNPRCYGLRPSEQAWFMHGNCIMCHPVMAAQIRKRLGYAEVTP